MAASFTIAATTLGGNFVDSLASIFVLVYLRRVRGMAAPVLGEREIVFVEGYAFLLQILLLCWLSKHLARVFFDKTGKWYLMLAWPLLAVTAVADVANWGASRGILMRSGGDLGIYYDQLFSHIGACVLTGLSALAAGFYVFGMERIDWEQKKSSQYQAQIAAYRMLTEQERQTRRLRHDLKNHLLALSGLLEQREWEKMAQYLGHMRHSGGFDERGETSGNLVVDALLAQKRLAAEAMGIQWECEVQVPKRCGIREFDLCVLFGNVLDNALEACERLKQKQPSDICPARVEIQARTVKKMFYLEVKNTAAPEERPRSGFTSKEDPHRHGIGLFQVKEVAKRYNGVVKIEQEAGMFTISALLPFDETDADCMKQ